MLSLTGFNNRFTSNWRLYLLALLVITLLIKLGMWQLARAHEKETMLAANLMFKNKIPIVWDPKSSRPQQYQRVRIEGYYLPQVLLLDNQHYQHQFGYHVLSPLVLTNNQVVIIDRGWILGDVTRRTFPKIKLKANKKIRLMGDVYYPSDKNWLLGPVLEKKQPQLAIVELVDTKAFSKFLHKSVYPFIIRLDKDEAYGYVREWATVAMSPQRHYAYALQWFLMGGIILILSLVLKNKS